MKKEEIYNVIKNLSYDGADHIIRKYTEQRDLEEKKEQIKKYVDNDNKMVIEIIKQMIKTESKIDKLVNMINNGKE